MADALEEATAWEYADVAYNNAFRTHLTVLIAVVVGSVVMHQSVPCYVAASLSSRQALMEHEGRNPRDDRSYSTHTDRLLVILV